MLNAWILRKYSVPLVKPGMDTVEGKVVGSVPVLRVETVVHAVPLVDLETT